MMVKRIVPLKRGTAKLNDMNVKIKTGTLAVHDSVLTIIRFAFFSIVQNKKKINTENSKYETIA